MTMTCCSMSCSVFPRSCQPDSRNTGPAMSARIVQGRRLHSMDKDWEELSIAEAFNLLDTTETLPSLDRYLFIVKKCRETRVLAHAKYLHVHLCNAGLEVCGALESEIVPMFLECGALKESLQAFERMLDCNEYAWSCLIQYYFERGELKEVFEIFQKMQENGRCVTKYALIALLRACVVIECSQKCREVHVEIVKMGHERDILVGRFLVDTYIKLNFMDDARSVFDHLNVQNVVLWTMLMKGYAEKGCDAKALECIEEMQGDGVYPDVVTFLCSLKACNNIGIINKAQDIHAQLVKVGLEDDSFVGSALIRMYANHGLLEEACDVFDKLIVHDTFLWNTLMTGYCDYGLYQEVLDLFDELKHDGMHPDAMTFVCILRACCCMGELNRGQEAHTEIATDGLENNLFVSSALIDMYTASGLVEEARAVFGDLPSKDVVSWTSLIAGYAENGLVKETLHCVEQMQLEGVAPDMVTFSSCLNACGHACCIDQGQEVFTDAVRRGIERHLAVESSLIQMYAACQSLAEAQYLFDKLQAPNIGSWNALIAGYTDNWLSVEALKYFKQMQYEGVLPNAFTFFACLKACESGGNIHNTLEIHAEIVKNEFERDPSIGNTLVSVYAKLGYFVDAWEVFDELLVVDQVSWSALAAGYADLGHGEKAMNCLGQMQKSGLPYDFVTYICSIKACGSIQNTDRCYETHSDIVKVGLEKDLIIASSLIDMYAKWGLLYEAENVFDGQSDRDVVSWTSLIAAYAEHDFIEETLFSLKLMASEGVLPNILTFFYALQACISTGTIDEGHQIHMDLIALGLEDDCLMSQSLVDLYVKCGLPIDAQELLKHVSCKDVLQWNVVLVESARKGVKQEAIAACFEHMQVNCACPDIVSWNALMLVCTEQEEINQTVLVFNQMLEQGALPDTTLFISIIKACRYVSMLVCGERIHAQLFQSGGLERNELCLATTLVEMYGMCGNMATALLVFDGQVTKNTYLWNALITGYGKQGENMHVLQLYEMMRQKGDTPNRVTLLHVLTACNHGGFPDKAQQHFDRMTNELSLTPTIEHCNCMVDLFGRSGQIYKALPMVKEIPYAPNHSLWCSILRACLVWGNMEVAVEVFNSAMKIKEEHSGLYLLMSNLYASAHIPRESQNGEAMEAENQENNTALCEDKPNFQTSMDGKWNCVDMAV